MSIREGGSAGRTRPPARRPRRQLPRDPCCGWLPCAFSTSAYCDTSATPGLRRRGALGANYQIRRGPILVGQPAVHGRPIPVFSYVAAVRVGEQFVQPRRSVVRAGGMKAHGRRALECFERPHAGHARCRPRLRHVVGSRADPPARLEVGHLEAGRKLGIPLMQSADPRGELSRPPGPGCRALTRPVSALHLPAVHNRAGPTTRVVRQRSQRLHPGTQSVPGSELACAPGITAVAPGSAGGY